MTQKDFDKFVARLGEALNRHDLKGLAALYAEGAVRIGPAWSEARGREAAANTRDPLFRAFPNLSVKVHRYFWAGDFGFVEWTWAGTHTSLYETPQGTIAPTGKRVELSGVSIFEFDRYGYIVKEQAYFDVMTMMSQMGQQVARAA